MLKTCYGGELAKCEGMGAPLKTGNLAPLKPNERELHLVAVPGGLHWVERRPDGTYMDPASGKNFNSKGDLPIYYADTGVGIVLTGK